MPSSNSASRKPSDKTPILAQKYTKRFKIYRKVTEEKSELLDADFEFGGTVGTLVLCFVWLAALVDRTLTVTTGHNGCGIDSFMADGTAFVDEHGWWAPAA